MTGEAEEKAVGSGFVDQILTVAETAGASVAVPMLQSMVQKKVIRLLNDNGPEDLRELIEVQYPLVQEDLDENIKQALGRVGPKFEGQIKRTVNPEAVMHWMNNPDEYIEADEAEIEQIEACAEIIEETPGGDRWLMMQVITLWEIAEIA